MDQLIAMGYGEQSGFSMKDLMATALTSGITGGVLQQNGMLAHGRSIMQNFPVADLATNVMVSEEVTIAQQAALLATGLQKKFDWRTLAVAGFNGAAGYTINKGIDSTAFPVLNATVNAGVDGVADSLIMNQNLGFAQLSANVTGTMVGNYAGHTLSEAYKDRTVTEKKSETNTKYRASVSKTREAANDSIPAYAQHATKAARWNANRAPAKAWDRGPTNALNELADTLNALDLSDSPYYARNVADNPATSTSTAREESWGMRQLYNINNALEPYAHGLDTFNSYAGPIAKGLVLAASGYGLTAAIPAAIPTLLRVAAPFGNVSMETVGIPTVTMTSLEASLAGTGVFLGGATKYGSELLSKVGLWRSEAGAGRLGISASSPSEIAWGYGELSPRQAKLLGQLPETRSVTQLYKSDVNVTDLASLTAKTGDEFAMFTLGSRRMIIRGGPNGVKMGEQLLEKIQSQGWKWSAHTHPGVKDLVLNASGYPGDRAVLGLLGQERSLILNSAGRRNLFDLKDDMRIASRNEHSYNNRMTW